VLFLLGESVTYFFRSSVFFHFTPDSMYYFIRDVPEWGFPCFGDFDAMSRFIEYVKIGK